MSETQAQSVAIAKAEFRFREDKTTKYKRPTLELNVPYATQAGLQEILSRDSSDKTVDLILDTMAGTVNNFLRGYVNEDKEFSQEKLDAMVAEGQVSLDYIANLARSSRSRITNDDLAGFGVVFVEVAKQVQDDPELRIASEAGATVAAQAFADRLQAAAGKNDILDKLEAMLNKFINAASDEILAEHQSVIEWLGVKLEEGRQKEELNLDNLD